MSIRSGLDMQKGWLYSTPRFRIVGEAGLREVETPLHALDASFGVNDALFSSEIRMALATYLHFE
jgi:hypothetical protein